MTVIEVGTDYADISWSPPRDDLHNGVIRHYYVQLTTEITNITKIVSTVSTSIFITDLHPYTEYSVRIAGHTTRTGPYSEPEFLQTLTDCKLLNILASRILNRSLL